MTNTYDAFHRLVERATAGGKLRFVYDNRWRVIAEYDQNDTLVNRYVYGPEIDEPVRLTRMGVHRYYHQAALGTVTEVTARAGIVNERYTYDVYGQVTTIQDAWGNWLTNSHFGNRFLFQGRDRDPDTGLYNFRYRTYSPTLGRFLQVDPIRERGGWNLYAFVANNAPNKTDPFGLWSWSWPPWKDPKPNPSDPPSGQSKCCNEDNPFQELFKTAADTLAGELQAAGIGGKLPGMYRLLNLAKDARKGCGDMKAAADTCSRFAADPSQEDAYQCCMAILNSFPGLGGYSYFQCHSLSSVF